MSVARRDHIEESPGELCGSYAVPLRRCVVQHRHLGYICAKVLGVFGSNGLRDTLWIVPIKCVVAALSRHPKSKRSHYDAARSVIVQDAGSQFVEVYGHFNCR